MKIATVSKPVVSAWSPDSGNLALGRVAGTIDDNFDISSSLEVFKLSRSGKIESISTTDVDDRFHRLVWHKDLIAGGLDNGSVQIWNAQGLKDKTQTEPVVKLREHTGAVKGLDFNSLHGGLLASGGPEGEVFIYDVSKDVTSPQTSKSGPKAPSQTGQISAVQWNRKVVQILGSASFDGSVVVWDVRAQKSVLTIANQGQRLPFNTLCWTADATRLLTASGSDSQPVIQLWDLKNVMAPVQTFKGHEAGIYGMSWSNADPDLLLTCAKDNRTLCWNLSTGQVQAEIDNSRWNFDVQWSPKMPGLLSACSFEGLDVFSVHDFSSPPPSKSEFGFQQQGNSQQLKGPQQPPRWLRRPAGVAFGFGGKIVSFNAASKAVKISQVVTDPEFVDQASKLQERLKEADLNKLCEEKLREAKAEEASSWQMIKMQFDPEKRKQILKFLGYDAQTIAGEVKKFNLSVGGEGIVQLDDKAKDEPKKKKNDEDENAQIKQEEANDNKNNNNNNKQSTENSKNNTFFEGNVEPSEFDDLLTPSAENNNTTNNKEQNASSFQESVSSEEGEEDESDSEEVEPIKWTAPTKFESSGAESQITSALLIGNFELAVDTCLRSGKVAEAFVLAAHGGQDLWFRTQEAFFRKNDTSFMRVVSYIVKDQLQDLVETVELSQWKAALAILCTYAKKDDFVLLCSVLGDRLLSAGEPANAAVCFISSGNIAKSIQLWTESKQDLLQIVEKVAVFRKALTKTDRPAWSSAVASKFAEFAATLASQGETAAALDALAFLEDFDYKDQQVLRSPAFALFHRLYYSASPRPTLAAPPPALFYTPRIAQQKTQQQTQPSRTQTQPLTQPLPSRGGSSHPPAPVPAPTRGTSSSSSSTRMPPLPPMPVATPGPYTNPPIPHPVTVTTHNKIAMPPVPTFPVVTGGSHAVNHPAPAPSVMEPPRAEAALQQPKPRIAPPPSVPSISISTGSGPSSSNNSGPASNATGRIGPTPFGPLNATTTVKRAPSPEPEVVRETTPENREAMQLVEQVARNAPVKETTRERLLEIVPKLESNTIGPETCELLKQLLSAAAQGDPGRSAFADALKDLIRDHFKVIGQRSMVGLKELNLALYPKN